MVNNLSEEKRGKPCMVINYKRLNDVTVLLDISSQTKKYSLTKPLVKSGFQNLTENLDFTRLN